MKKIILLLLAICWLVACKTKEHTTSTTTVETLSYIQITSPKVYASKTVMVTIDDVHQFEAVVTRTSVKPKKGKKSFYPTVSGVHKVKITHNGLRLYEAHVVLKAGTKSSITLP